IVQRDSQAGKAFVQSLGATYEFNEYWMSLQEKKELPMTHPLQLRLAQEEELDFVGDAMAAAFDGFEKEVYVNSIAPMEKQTNSERYLILHDETPVGTLAISFPHENAAFVFGFCVLPEYQGRGYGRQALMLAVQNMRAIGRETIDLEVACENLSALGLYQSCGFQVASANDYYVLTTPSS
ncbi:MAG: GNAT family N-acetyltransferase, partial [Tumebacillaceae bacterium]